MKPVLSDLWDCLEKVPDPEIPAISIVDLGIVRELRWDDDVLEVAVTPTYSGCPATSVISMEIETALRNQGVEKLRINTQIAPPWTTDWMSEKGRDKLAAYGIAPPNPSGGPAACPLCASPNVTRVSQFGSTPCKAHWRCDDCLEPFDYFKCH